MRILILSDTHGQCDRVYQIYKKLISEAPIDRIVHCGDYVKDAQEIHARLAVPVSSVRGNCDGGYEDTDWSILETEAGNFLITHGHMQQVDFSQQNLYYMAIENGCIGAFYGHTHRAAYTSIGDVHLMNPGSISKPRDRSSGTFGLIVTDDDSVWGKIYDYSDFIGADDSISPICSKNQDSDTAKPQKEKKSKVRGGKLRDMLNYSDRF